MVKEYDGSIGESLRTESHPWWSSPLPWISANGGLGDDVFLMEYQRLPPFDSVTKVIIRSYHENLKTVRWGGGDDVICVHEWEIVFADSGSCVRFRLHSCLESSPESHVLSLSF